MFNGDIHRQLVVDNVGIGAEQFGDYNRNFRAAFGVYSRRYAGCGSRNNGNGEKRDDNFFHRKLSLFCDTRFPSERVRFRFCISALKGAHPTDAHKKPPAVEEEKSTGGWYF
jgi:hypothetical protein